MKRKFTDEETTYFVKLYRQHECLWNIFLPEFKDYDHRRVAIDQIVFEMNIDGFTKNEFENKVKSLQSRYCLEISKIEKSKNSKVGTELVYEPKIQWFSDMKYIMDLIISKNNKTESKLDVDTAPDVHGSLNDYNETETRFNKEELVEDDNVCNDQKISNSNKRKLISSNCSSNMKHPKKPVYTKISAIKELKVLNKLLSAAATPCASTVEDECEIMGKQIAVQLRSLPEQTRLKANFEIQRILMDFRMDYIKSKSSVSDHEETMSSCDNICTIVMSSTSSESEINDQLDQPRTILNNINYEHFKSTSNNSGFTMNEGCIQLDD